ncbi:TPA: hypothetical protein OT075_002412 [Klebsiella quasipneumoniae]|nr:hypothetical protein [Klebsiella quasipneumoniae]
MTEYFSFYDSEIAEQNDRLSSIASPDIAHKIGEKQQVKIKKGRRRQPFAKEIIRYSTVTDFARLRG